MGKRYEELDSIRGIAALVVLLSHFLFIFINVGGFLKSNFGIVLSALWNGHGSVIMFFVISGFVLSLAFIKDNKPKYTHYLIKRFSRIYIPYLIILFIAIIIKFFLESKLGNVPNLFLGDGWYEAISLKSVINHVLFLGEYNHDTYIMVIWSLIHEMRISIVFPLIVVFLLKFDWKISIGSAIILSFISNILINVFPTNFTSNISSNYFITLHYLSMFIFGFLIANHREKLIDKVKDSKLKIPMFFIGLVILNYPNVPYSVLAKLTGDLGYRPALMIMDWITTFGAVLIILFVLSSKILSKFLLIKPIRLLGEISYSLYLIHPVVLLTIIYVFYGTLSIPLLLITSFILTLILSWFSYKYIEKPSIQLGKYLTSSNNVIQKQASA